MKLVLCFNTLALASAFMPMHIAPSHSKLTRSEGLRMSDDASDETSQPVEGEEKESKGLRMSDDASDETSQPIEGEGKKRKSAAVEWAKLQEESANPKTTTKKKFAVVGGGWGGWGAAKALCEADDVEVTLLDALPDPTGATPFLSKTGKPGTSCLPP
jgi:gas vesicle protein